jgi:hypothetical protein
MKILVSSVIGCFLICTGLWAQTTTTSQIGGMVKDVSGASVPGAEVKVTQTETGMTRSVVSDDDGSYRISSLPVGPYQLQVSLQGFSTYVQTGIVLTVGANPVINPVLKVGSITEQVEVNANAAMVETKENSVGQLIDEQRVVELPLNGRQVTSLLELSGAAVQSNTGSLVGARNYPTAAAISVAGGQGSSTVYLMDGGLGNDPITNVGFPMPFPDALREFKVETAGPARYGFHPGAVVNGVTKSGTNEIHGSLFEFVRNYKFNARNTFAPKRDSLKRNQFGGTIGGPITPNKLFFFAGFQGTITKTAPSESVSYVPTAAMRSGDFSVMTSPPCRSTPINLPAPFVNNKIDPALFNPVAQYVMKYVPVSTDPCGKITWGTPQNYHEEQVLGRIDYQRSDNQSIYGRYFGTHYITPTQFDGKNILTAGYQGLNDYLQTFAFGDTYMLSSNTISSLHASFARSAVNRTIPKDMFTSCDAGVKITCLNTNVISMNISGYWNNQSIFKGHMMTNQYQLAQDFDLMRGAHQFAFGANWIYSQLNSLLEYIGNGRFTFNGSITGYAPADFLLGKPSLLEQANAQMIFVRGHYLGLYAQDTWRVSPRLTLNYGIRWEPYMPVYTNKNKYTQNFDPARFAAKQKSSVFVNAPAGLLFPGDQGYPGNQATAGRMNQFAPRFGIVYDPAGNGRQTIRASYGLFYDWPYMWLMNHFPEMSPWGNRVQPTAPTGGLSDPYLDYPGGNPFPTPANPPKDFKFPSFADYYSWKLDMKPLYMQQWNFSFQKQLGADWMLSANYLGNKTSHLWLGRNLNRAVYIPGQCTAGQYGLPKAGACSSTANTNYRRTLYLADQENGKYYGNEIVEDDGANASYNALLISVNKRMSRNITAQGNYTWSHCITEGDYGMNIGDSFQDINNRRADRGSCAADRRQMVNLSMVAETPKFGSKWLQTVVGNWQSSLIFKVRSGPYATITSGTDRALTNASGQRPNLIGDPTVANPTAAQWFNQAAYQANGPGQYGNVGRTTMLAPGSWGIDLSLVRRIQVRESQRIEIRAEAFNLLNHANLGSPGAALNSASFGKINSADDPRIMQFALKYSF